MDDLLSAHRKEQRDLQSRITQKKKNATKKTRKGVNDECDRLERELAEKHQAELNALQPAAPDQLKIAVQDLSIDDAAKDHGDQPVVEHDISQTANINTLSGDAEVQGRLKKPNRQKARLARRAAEQEAATNAAALEAKNLPNQREQELSAMKRHMENLKLEETLIRPDGHCLFSACASGMPSEIVSKSGPGREPYQNVRLSAAEFMATHPDDFAPFLEEPLDLYIRKIRDTAEWGGELELQAIARSYNVEINVLQADGRVQKIVPDSEGSGNPIWLAYYRHSFGLGEHYNALKQADTS